MLRMGIQLTHVAVGCQVPWLRTYFRLSKEKRYKTGGLVRS